jgi:oligopeptide transport system substrate-binding protein
VLLSWTPGGTIELSKNASYWDRDNVQIHKVQYQTIADENAQLLRYRAGQLDITQSVPAGALSSVRQELPNELHVTPYLATAFYVFNLHTSPLAGNLNLRKALAMAVDRKVLLTTLLPFGQTPAYGFVPPGTWNYQPQSWEWAELPDSIRIAEAQRLYEKAGFKRQVPLHLKLLFNSNPIIKQLAIAVTSTWKQTLGVETELIDEEFRVFLDSRKDTSRWDVLRFAWTADYNDATNFLDTFRSNSPNNSAGYSNAQFDALIDEAARSADIAKRRGLLEAAERLMLSEYPVMPIYFFSSKRLIKPYIRGDTTDPLNRMYSKHLAIQRQ